MKKRILAIAAAAFSFAAFGEVLNLNSGWEYRRAADGALFPLKAALAGAGIDPAAGAFPGEWEKVSVPHCVNAHDIFDGHVGSWGERDFYRGFMFYRRKASLPGIAGKKVFLEIEAIRQSAYLWVNGEFIGYYEAGIAPIGFDVSRAVRDGENEFFLATDNAGFNETAEFETIETLPGAEPGSGGGVAFQWNRSDFNPVQGGLTGNVRLHVKPSKTYLTLPLYNNLKTVGTYVWADDFDFASGAATIHVLAEVRNESGKPVDARLEVVLEDAALRSCTAKAAPPLCEIQPAADAGVVFPSALEADVYAKNPAPTGLHEPETVKIETSFRAEGLTFWSPDTPHLYDVKVALVGANGAVLDAETIRTGFRKIEYDFERGGLFINGKNFTLPGYAQRAADCWAAIGLPTDWLMDWEMELVRESNANHIRWMHVAAKPNAVRSCDKAGIVQTCPAGDKEFETKGRQWAQRVEAMRDVMVYFRNSPSIFFWEAGNNQISPEHMREMRLLKELIDPANGRFMGCRTLQTPEQIAEAEYVGTMINRHDAGAFHSMQTLHRYLPITETEFCREEAPRRVWDDFTPPDFDYVNRWLGRGNRENGFDAHDKTQEDLARSNASDSGWTYFWGNRVNGKAARFYTGWAMLCWSDMIEMGRNSASENSRVSGRVDAVRVKKENFYVLQTLQSELPAVKLLGHWSYPPFTEANYWYHGRRDTGHHWEWTDERLRRDPHRKTVYAIASKHAASVELVVNGRSLGVKTETSGGPFTYAFEGIDVTESGYAEAIARDANGNIIARDRIDTVGPVVRIDAKVTTGPEGFLADGSDLAMIDLALVDSEGRTHPYANDRIVFRLEGEEVSERGLPARDGAVSERGLPARDGAVSERGLPARDGAVFMGGFNSGTFRGDAERPSPVGTDWVRFECGVARVFVRAGFAPGRVVLRADCERGLSATIPLKLLPAAGRDPHEPPQAFAPNRRDYTVVPTAPQVREYKPKSGNLPPYTVLVNGVKVDFHRNNAKPVKPDDNTGVVAPYGPVLRAIRDAGAEIEIFTIQNPEKAKKLPDYLKGFKPPYLKVTAPGGHTIECVKGETVVYFDAGTEKNLSNCEIFEDSRHELAGELMAVLQYLPVKVAIDDTHRTVSIETTPREQ